MVSSPLLPVSTGKVALFKGFGAARSGTAWTCRAAHRSTVPGAGPCTGRKPNSVAFGVAGTGCLGALDVGRNRRIVDDAAGDHVAG